jgi:nucleoid-associated protein YgaU
MRVVVVVGLLACLGAGANIAFADDPPAAPRAAATPAAPAPATPATPAAAAQPAAAANAAEAAAGADDSNSKERHFLAEGYHLEMHHGQKMYCRKEEVLGTRLGAKSYCSTLEQLDSTERDAKRAMDHSTWQQNNPTGR